MPDLKAVISGVLCGLLIGQPVVYAQQQAAPAEAKTAAAAAATGPLTADQRIVHVLNRFTFGPTTDAIAEVKSLGPNGIDKWFDQQLHPDKLPNARLEGRLDQYPAMGLPVNQLIVSFPGSSQIKQVVNGKLAVPEDPAFSAIYQHQIAVYEAKQAKKAADKTNTAKADAGANAGGEMTAKTQMAANPTAPALSGDAAAEGNQGNKSNPTLTAPARVERVSAVRTLATRPAFGDLLVDSVLNLPPAERVDRILNMQPAAYDEFRANLKGPRRAKLTADLQPAEKELLADFDNPERAVIDELEGQRLVRDIYSESQLAEVMTTFWLNHFNVFLHKNEETPYYLVSYERDVIRPYALGKFEDLLDAVATSPAMMLYLDNSSSVGPDSQLAQRPAKPGAGKAKTEAPAGINENYARELMELHTLGVNGGYTQNDVTEVAKVFTGWGVSRPANGEDFVFRFNRHEPGKKLVLGHKIKEDGQQEGFEVLHILATSPATAHFISKKLAVQFVSDHPPAALVDSMARTFLKSHGDIPAVLKTMLHSPEFWSREAYQAKVKTPLEYVVSAARTSGADVTNTQPLVNALKDMGMPLFGCVPPTGYSATEDAWVNTGALVTRMNFAVSLADNKFNGVTSRWAGAAPPIPVTTSDEKALETRILPAGVSDKSRAAVSEQLEEQAKAASPEKKLAGSAGLLLGSPEFQRR
jgi:uncharacterized protein (DUF1800 family)